MAISRWCTKCYSDNSVSNKVCSKCSASLSHGKHRERIKVKGKWKSRVFTRDDAQVSLDQTVSWKAYYASARLIKKSHENDLQIYEKYLEGKDWFSTEGILGILADAKDAGRVPATVRHIYTTIRRIHNWHIKLDTHPTGKNPCKPIKLTKVDNTVTNPPGEEEVYGVLGYLENHSNRRMAIIVSLALLTGRRQGEILKLRKQDIQVSHINRFGDTGRSPFCSSLRRDF